MTAINFDFVSAFVYVVIFGYEPEFRFVYEEGEYPKMWWVSLGRFARIHGVYVDIDYMVYDECEEEEWILPDEFDFSDEEDDDNWFDIDDLKDVPDFDCPNWGAIMAAVIEGGKKYLQEEIFDWYDIIEIPDVDSWDPEWVFDLSF